MCIASWAAPGLLLFVGSERVRAWLPLKVN
jgi:hypothetical protein